MVEELMEELLVQNERETERLQDNQTDLHQEFFQGYISFVKKGQDLPYATNIFAPGSLFGDPGAQPNMWSIMGTSLVL